MYFPGTHQRYDRQANKNGAQDPKTAARSISQDTGRRDLSGGDGGGGGQNNKAWKEEQRGARRIERRDEHARDAAEKSEVWRKNPRDGIWRRSVAVSQPGPVISAHGGLWRPWVAHEDTEETVQTIVSVADPKNHNHPVYFSSTDTGTRSPLQLGKLSEISEGTSLTL